MKLYEYYQKINELTKNNKLRYGQNAFNYLNEINPQLANKIRTTNCDPFYISDGTINAPTWSDTWKNFTKFLQNNWTDS